MRIKKSLALVLCLLTVDPTSSFAAKKVVRKPQGIEAPPQFVLFAFDGSYNNNFWKESIEFASKVPTTDSNNQETTLKFTYFVNPPYYVKRQSRDVYKTPTLGKPVSCIGWAGETPQEIAEIVPRMEWTNRAFSLGHEIGSHANSHCNAKGDDPNNPVKTPFKLDDWRSEFSQFNKIFFDLYRINGIKPTGASSSGFSFTQKDIVGFRAPLLAVTPGLRQTMKEFGFRYDTSYTDVPTYWPQKDEFGIWNFPLGVIKIAGRSDKVFSMDYNWMCKQTACLDKGKSLSAEQLQSFKNQVLDSYKYYFKKNYYGARGPVNIGHHFSKWNGGIYWQAMKEFAQFVCSKPDVHCVTYKEYANWLESQPKDLLAAYRAGQFNKLRDDQSIRDIATPILADVRLDRGEDGFEVVVDEDVQRRLNSLGWSKRLTVDFKPVDGQTAIKRDKLISMVGTGKTAIIRASIVNRNGLEINWQSRRIENLGTADESLSNPLEEGALRGEPAEAHDSHNE